MITFFLTILIILSIILLLYLLAIMPRISHRDQCRQFSRQNYAHRGLFSNGEGVPENSMSAFQQALSRGFPIELDVQLTKDKQAVVFHDDSLKRMCGIDALVCQKTYDELNRLSLLNSSQRIPLFSEVLSAVNGRVPLLVELKTIGKNTMVSVVTNELLLRYKGPYCIESFSPFVLHWFKKHRPDILRGQLSERFHNSKDHPRFLLFMARHLLFNWYSKPDFIAYDYHQAGKCPAVHICQRLFKIPIFAWTIRSADIYQHCRKHYNAIIFDSFIPQDTTY